ncbi:MAG: hypothetical protein KDA28_14345, partial [Phycisphaerales bacterium]|nr:hypothetical protein [Phycisphaerales bacterium]
SDFAEIGRARMAYVGNELELAVPRSLLDQTGVIAFTFHWADHVADDTGEIPEFGVLGDNAPSRRASYPFAPW